MANDRTFKLNLPQAIGVRAAILKQCKKLEKLEADALDSHKGTLAQQVKDEREGLLEETVDKLSKLAVMAGPKKVVEIELNSVEWRAVDGGLPKLIRDTRAAKGTVRALLKEKWAEELEKDAKLFESQLVPMFAEQKDMLAEDQHDEEDAD